MREGLTILAVAAICVGAFLLLAFGTAAASVALWILWPVDGAPEAAAWTLIGVVSACGVALCARWASGWPREASSIPEHPAAEEQDR